MNVCRMEVHVSTFGLTRLNSMLLAAGLGSVLTPWLATALLLALRGKSIKSIKNIYIYIYHAIQIFYCQMMPYSHTCNYVVDCLNVRKLRWSVTLGWTTALAPWPLRLGPFSFPGRGGSLPEPALGGGGSRPVPLGCLSGLAGAGWVAIASLTRPEGGARLRPAVSQTSEHPVGGSIRLVTRR